MQILGPPRTTLTRHPGNVAPGPVGQSFECRLPLTKNKRGSAGAALVLVSLSGLWTPLECECRYRHSPLRIEVDSGNPDDFHSGGTENGLARRELAYCHQISLVEAVRNTRSHMMYGRSRILNNPYTTPALRIDTQPAPSCRPSFVRYVYVPSSGQVLEHLIQGCRYTRTAMMR